MKYLFSHHLSKNVKLLLLSAYWIQGFAAFWCHILQYIESLWLLEFCSFVLFFEFWTVGSTKEANLKIFLVHGDCHEHVWVFGEFYRLNTWITVKLISKWINGKKINTGCTWNLSCCRHTILTPAWKGTENHYR